MRKMTKSQRRKKIRKRKMRKIRTKTRRGRKNRTRTPRMRMRMRKRKKKKGKKRSRNMSNREEGGRAYTNPLKLTKDERFTSTLKSRRRRMKILVHEGRMINDGGVII